MKTIIPCLWFDTQAEQAVNFYISVFKNSSIDKITRYGKAGFEIHKKPAGTVMTVAFSLNGKQFLALNGGPEFHFNESISMMVNCENQAEIDYFWEKLSEGGEEGPCGWLKDKFGLSWQVVPTILQELLSDPMTADNAMTEMLQMKKLDIDKLKASASKLPTI